MAGIPITANDVNYRVGQLAVDIRNKLAEVANVKRVLDDLGDAGLLALGLAQADVDLLQATVTDLDKLARVAVGQETQAEASDFFFNARHVTGLN